MVCQLDKVEFAAFVREQQEPLRRFLLNLSGGDGVLADDIAQDAFIKAYTGLSSFHDKTLVGYVLRTDALNNLT